MLCKVSSSQQQLDYDFFGRMYMGNLKVQETADCHRLLCKFSTDIIQFTADHRSRHPNPQEIRKSILLAQKTN